MSRNDLRRAYKFLCVLICLGWLLSGMACNRGRVCVRPTLDLTREPYGATDLNAESGNQGLSVGFNGAGTITVFKWPNPSYYDQVKYMTTTRDRERLGALPNEGVLAGLYYETKRGPGFCWLRELPHGQRYLGPRSVAVKTAFVHPELRLEIDQLDFVEPKADVLWRHYQARRLAGSGVKAARLLFYANFRPQISKLTGLPLEDWCLESRGSSTLRWNQSDEIFFQDREGTDHSTGKPSAVWLALGLDRPSRGHQAGYDSACVPQGKTSDAFLLGPKGNLPGSDRARGKATAGLLAELSLESDGQAEVSFLIAGAKNEEQARALISSARAKGFGRALAEVEDYWGKLLDRVPLPATDDERIREVALRSVIVLLLGHCRESGAMVASIATQPPYSLDWPRDGSYMNEALLAAGFPELVRNHNRFYAEMQSRPGHKIPRVPEGNWASNYYADGVPAMPYIWWELDETAFGVWTLFRYYETTRDLAYLREVYPAIQRAADFLAHFRDPATGLPRPANETDVPFKAQSIRGALCAFMGLDYAAKAAAALGDDSSRRRWQDRQAELRRVILDQFYDPSCRRFVTFPKQKANCAGPGAGYDQAMMIWPVGLLELSDPRAQEAALDAWKSIAPSYSGERQRGSYEVYTLVVLAKIWKDDPEKMTLVKEALRWETTVPITETGHFGEIWVRQGDQVYTGEAQPQLWTHALFYLTAMETYGP